MSWLSVALTLAPRAFAGYADASDGLPTWADRELFLWTNAVRIDPAAFQDDYPCSFSSFSAFERTSQAPLLFEPGLAEAASFHSHDMLGMGELDHTSSDGTAWSDRIRRYYSGFTIAENIAWGYGSPWSAVVEGWMCSDGHRANLMSPDYTELGTGVAGVYYTQDFGGGSPPVRGMAMGLHRPEDPGAEVELVVDWSAPAPPDALWAVLGSDTGDGVRVDLTRSFGADERGLYSVTLPTSAWPSSVCQSYYFVATLGPATETWPEDGSYGFGDCDWADPGARWLDTQAPLPLETSGETEETGETGDDPTQDEPDEDEPDADEPEDELSDEDKGSVPLPGGCACDGSGGRPGLALLALALLVRRTGRKPPLRAPA